MVKFIYFLIVKMNFIQLFNHINFIVHLFFIYKILIVKIDNFL